LPAPSRRIEHPGEFSILKVPQFTGDNGSLSGDEQQLASLRHVADLNFGGLRLRRSTIQGEGRGSADARLGDISATRNPVIAFGSEARVFAATTTQAGLKVRCEIDANTYPKGVKVEDDEMAALKIRPHDFHSEWNYTISPRTLN
jgi:hypothetical protein